MTKSKFFFAAACALFALSLLFATAAFLFIAGKSLYWREAPANPASGNTGGQIQELNKTRADWQNIEKEYARFRADYIMKDSDFAEFRDALDSMIHGCGLQRRSISFSPYGLDHLKLKFYRVTMAITGDYLNLKRLLGEIERQKKMFFVTGVVMVQEKGQVAATVDMEAYFVQ